MYQVVKDDETAGMPRFSGRCNKCNLYFVNPKGDLEDVLFITDWMGALTTYTIGVASAITLTLLAF